MIYDRKSVEKACREYERNWAVLDKNLYRVCRENSGHQTTAGVNAKLWLIGRAYATGIERVIPSDGTQGGSLSKLSRLIVAEHRKVDSIIRPILEVSEPLTAAKLLTIATVHGQFLSLIRSICRRDRTPRSFVSKYLHFHCPAVPIYDSLAVQALRKMCPWQKSMEVFKVPSGADEEYSWYLMRFFSLYVAARDSKAKVTVKTLDNFILNSKRAR